MASRVLELRFNNAAGRNATVRVPDVKDPYTGAEAAQLMDNILAKNIFATTGGDFVAKDSARIIVTDITDLELS